MRPGNRRLVDADATSFCCATEAEGAAREFLDSNGECCNFSMVDACGVCSGGGLVFSQQQNACCIGNPALGEGLLDINGNCCNNAQVNACGICGGPPTAVMDYTGTNCCLSGILDEQLRCCASGMLDECNVCDGDGTSCGLLLEIGMTSQSSEAACEDPEQLAAIEAQLLAQAQEQGDPYGIGQPNAIALQMEEACANQVCAGQCDATGCGMRAWDANSGTCACAGGVTAVLEVEGGGNAQGGTLEAVGGLEANCVPVTEMSGLGLGRVGLRSEMYRNGGLRRRLVAEAPTTPQALQITVPAGSSMAAAVNCDLLQAGANANPELAALLDTGDVTCTRATSTVPGTDVKALECPGVGINTWVINGQPTATKIVCSGHGLCSPISGACDCYAGYSGQGCEACPAGQELRNGICSASQASVLSTAAQDGTLQSIAAAPQVPVMPTPPPTPDLGIDAAPGAPGGPAAVPAIQRRVRAALMLQGLTKDSFGEARQVQFKAAVAPAVGLTPSDITITSVDDIESGLSVLARLRRALTGASAIRVGFEIMAPTKEAQQKLLNDFTGNAAFTSNFASAVRAHLVLHDPAAWSTLEAVAVQPGSVADPHSRDSLLPHDEGSPAFPVEIVIGLSLAVVAGIGALAFYRKRQAQGKRELVFNSKALPDTTAMVARNPLQGQAHSYKNSMDLGKYTAGKSEGATL
jgi:hypothetical protein